MDLRRLRYFVAVAEERSVGRAAERLRMAQPPLSVQIRKLESEIGAPLFHRGTRGMELTEAGQALLSRAGEALALAAEGAEAARAVAAGRRGRLSAVAALLRRHQVSMPIVGRVETVHSAISLVLAGEGLAILPACAELGSPRGVVFRPFSDAADNIEIALCWRRDSLSPLIRNFLKCAEKVVGRM